MSRNFDDTSPQMRRVGIDILITFVEEKQKMATCDWSSVVIKLRHGGWPQYQTQRRKNFA